MSTNDITGDKLQTKPASEAYRDGWDAIFKRKLVSLDEALEKIQGMMKDKGAVFNQPPSKDSK